MKKNTRFISVLLQRKQSKSKPEYTQNPEHLQRDNPGTN